MKRAPLTPEDFAILAKGYRDTPIPPGTPVRDSFWSGLLMGIAMLERDADLMLELVELRSIGAYGDVRHLQTMAGEDGCSVGGWMGHYRWESPKWSDGRMR